MNGAIIKMDAVPRQNAALAAQLSASVSVFRLARSGAGVPAA